MRETELKRIAGKYRVPVGTVEKDYILSLVLLILSNLEVSSKMVFKGGTAIKKIYYPEARFSEDLDFNYFDISVVDIKKAVDSIPSIDIFKSATFTRIKDENEVKDAYSCRVNYTGPLDYENSVKLDFSGKDRLLRKMVYKPIIDGYRLQDTVRGKLIQTMNLEEILAEKCRALMMRSMPRDLYDIWFLLEKKQTLMPTWSRGNLKGMRKAGTKKHSKKNLVQ
jgi:Uncharacterized conserved protein